MSNIFLQRWAIWHRKPASTSKALGLLPFTGSLPSRTPWGEPPPVSHCRASVRAERAGTDYQILYFPGTKREASLIFSCPCILLLLIQRLLPLLSTASCPWDSLVPWPHSRGPRFLCIPSRVTWWSLYLSPLVHWNLGSELHFGPLPQRASQLPHCQALELTLPVCP